jgi:hypothetical protein
VLWSNLSFVTLPPAVIGRKSALRLVKLIVLKPDAGMEGSDMNKLLLSMAVTTFAMTAAAQMAVKIPLSVRMFARRGMTWL